MKKRYAFVDYGGQVMAIEDRCSGFRRSEVESGELAVEEIVHPDFVRRYVEITAETGEAAIGMLYSDGKFIENPAAPDERIAALEAQIAAMIGTEEE